MFKSYYLLLHFPAVRAAHTTPIYSIIYVFIYLFYLPGIYFLSFRFKNFTFVDFRYLSPQFNIDLLPELHFDEKLKD
jgi:hypothetical protein